MVKKSMKIGLMVIAAVLLAGLVFAGAASAATYNTTIDTWEELYQNISDWGTAQEELIIVLGNESGYFSNGTMISYEGIPVTGHVTIMPNASIGTAEIVLDAGGHGRLFTVDEEYANLTLTGNGGKKLNLTGGLYSSAGGGIEVRYGANLTLCTDALITNCSNIFDCGKSGGGVQVSYGSTFTMTGGTITDCTVAATGGGVSLLASTFNMYGGTIDNNTASKGAGIVISPMSRFSISGEAIVSENNDVGLFIENPSIPVNISAYPAFNGKIGNITLYDSSFTENPAAWSGQTVIENGASVASWADKFKLSSAYTSNYLKPVNGDLILGPVSYPIYITNVTGTYQLNEVRTKVYSDGGSGYANLTSVVGDTYTLELNGFNASNMTGNVPIINASVPNLTVVLTGDSNLTGIFNADYKGLLYSSGNLTITTEDGGKLVVNKPTGLGDAICAKNDVTIENGTVTATAGNNAINACSGKVTINAGTINASSNWGRAISAEKEVTINAGMVNATGYSYAIYSHDGDVSINNGTITATGDDYAIYSNDDTVIINDGTVTATATGASGNAIYAGTDVIINNGAVTATGDDYAIYAFLRKVTINNGTITATATGAGSYAIYSGDSVVITSVDKLIANGTNAAFKYAISRDFSALGDSYSYWVNSTGSALPLIPLNYSQFNADGNWTDKKSAYTNVTIKPVTCAVTFEMQGRGTQIAPQEVRKGSCATEPSPAPTASGYTFGGWFNESSCTNAWDFATVVTNDTTLYAKWTQSYVPSSSSSQSGSTVILKEGQVAPTQTPVSAPTQAPSGTSTIKPTVNPTIKPTANPTANPMTTPQTPAPFAGLLLGLGAVAVLLRLRK